MFSRSGKSTNNEHACFQKKQNEPEFLQQSPDSDQLSNRDTKKFCVAEEMQKIENDEK